MRKSIDEIIISNVHGVFACYGSVIQSYVSRQLDQHIVFMRAIKTGKGRKRYNIFICICVEACLHIVCY